VRERLEGLLSPGLAAYLEAMAGARALVLAEVGDPGRRSQIFEALASDEFVARCLEAGPAAAGAMVLDEARELIAQGGAEQEEPRE
jgi:hypothetical protein